jgi:hypothetical protein
MKRSIALAAILALGGAPVAACAVAHLAPNAAAHSGPTRGTTAITTGALSPQVFPSSAAKTPVRAGLAICGMSVNNTWPSPAAGFRPVNTGTVSAVKLQCYFNDSPSPLHQTTLQIDGIFGPRS